MFKRLKESGIAGTLVKNRTPDEKPESDENDPSAAHEACGRAMLNAIKADDAKAMAQALIDLFQIADSEEHVEGSHIEPHSYQAQNQKAGQE